MVIRSENASSGNTDRISDQDIFRQHFESHFEPLPEAITSVDKGSTIGSKQNTESDATVGSDWEGLLGEKLIDKVEVVEYGEKTSSDTTDDVPDAKAFMVCPYTYGERNH